jgi:hypothetical protein
MNKNNMFSKHFENEKQEEKARWIIVSVIRFILAFE